VIDNENVSLVGSVQDGKNGAGMEVFFRYPKRFASFVADEGDAFVPALLLPSMAAGQDLEIIPVISEQLFNNLNTIQDTMCQWYPDLAKKVKISARSKKEYDKNPNTNVGCFFSLGVDSFYSLYKDIHNLYFNRPPISYLIYIKGLEAPLSAYRDHQEREVVSNILDVAGRTKKDVIIGETNIRDCFPLPWGGYYSGAGIASVGLSLGAGMKSVLIPAGHSYKEIHAYSTTPLVDPLWSTERTAIVHDGAETDRAVKIADFLAKEPLAMKYLRVCLKNNGGAYNCGKCGKCVRTMISLYISGNLAHADTFPKTISRKFDLKICEPSEVYFGEESLKLAKKYNADKWLAKSIAWQINMFKMKAILKDVSFFEAQRLVIIFYANLFKGNLLRSAKIIPAPVRNILKKILGINKKNTRTNPPAT